MAYLFIFLGAIVLGEVVVISCSGLNISINLGMRSSGIGIVVASYTK
jgi:hypothetical protein